MYHSQVVLGLGLSMKFSNFSNSYFMLWKMGYFMNYKYWIFAFFIFKHYWSKHLFLSFQLKKFHFKSYSIPIGVVIIDDHPEVTVVEDPQSNLNDDGFTEVVSKKQQKRLQDEERRKKEEQIIQV